MAASLVRLVRLCPIKGRFFQNALITKSFTNSAILTKVNPFKIQEPKFMLLNALNTHYRHYCSKENLTKEEIENKTLQVLRVFDKIDAKKLTLDAHFMKDLGLDSLDHIEVLMAIEDEFGFEIPDSEAEKLLHPKDIIQYIVDKGVNE